MLASPLSRTVAPLRPAACAAQLETVGRHVGGRQAQQPAQLALVRREHGRAPRAGEQLEPSPRA